MVVSRLLFFVVTDLTVRSVFVVVVVVERGLGFAFFGCSLSCECGVSQVSKYPLRFLLLCV